jgi:hypothetical protein
MSAMTKMAVVRTSISLSGLVLVLTTAAMGADIYITQSTSGSDSGANCANAHSAAWFNSNATGGNTYHLCGTFTGSANSTMLQPSQGGSNGSPLIIFFEAGAVLTSPQWSTNGAIRISQNYVVLDGGMNGLVTATDNGSPANASCPSWPGYTYHVSSMGVNIGSAHDVEVKNLTVSHIYRNDGTCYYNDDTGGSTSAAINVYSSATYNISIHDNNAGGASIGIAYGYSGYSVDNIQIYRNSISDMSWGIEFVDGSGTTSTATNSAIYGNTITGWETWKCPASSSFCNPGVPDAYHKDGIFLWKPLGNTVRTTIDIYNNYIYGDMSGGSTAGVYLTYGGGSGAYNNLVGRIFNNVIALTPAGVGIWFGGGVGNNNGDGTGDQLVYNNTLIGSTNNMGIIFYNGGSAGYSRGYVQNNIFSGWGLAMGAQGGGVNHFTTSCLGCDYNIYYNIGTGPTNKMFDSTETYNWSQWQAAGFDAHGAYADPKLTATYTLQSASPAIGLCANLTSLGITALDSDKAGVARPGSGAWATGAYQFSASKPNPPTMLTVIPH